MVVEHAVGIQLLLQLQPTQLYIELKDVMQTILPAHIPAQVLVHHGAKRGTDVHTLESADVVITTYSVIENEYRK
jgi:hypothetical protein